jgi:outer membrane protein assembly factor BamB
MSAAAVILEPAAKAQYGPRTWDLPPLGGAFFSLQLGGTNSAPLPWFPFDPAEVPVYPVLDLDNAFIFDDLNVNYSSDPRTKSSAFSSSEQSGSSDAPGTDFAQLSAFASCDDYGKRFYFSSITITSGVIHLTLTNTVAGFQYAIQRTPTLASPAWTQVQTITASGFVAVVPGINAGADQSGFFRATLVSDPLGLGWTNLLDAPITSSAATAGDCTAFISSASHLFALDFASGTIKWISNLDNSYTGELVPSPAVALDNSAVFAASQVGGIVALRPSDGHLLWSNSLGDLIFSSPAISPADGTVYLKTGSPGGWISPWLFALNPATGATNWVFQSQTPLPVGIESDASIAVGPDCMIYFVGTGGDLYAIHPDGSLAWFFPFRADSIPQSSPAFDSAGNILIGSADGYVYCLNSSSGGLKWLFSTGDSQKVSSPAIGADSTVYAATAGGSLFAITNGVLQWKYTAPDPNGYGYLPSFISSPAVNSNNVVFIGASDPNNGLLNGLFAVTNGALKAFYATVDGIYSSPLLARDNVIIADLSGNVYKFPGAGYPAAAAPWSQFRRNSRRTGASPNPICAGSTPIAFPNNPVITNNGAQFSFHLTGEAGSVWGVSVSTNLADWTTVGAVALDTNGDALFTDSAVARVTNRFYRAHCGQYCTRIIGFINQAIQPGINLIANPLFQINDNYNYYPQNTAKGWANLLVGLGLATPPDQTELRKWNGIGFDSAKWSGLGRTWDTNADLTLLPGQAFFIVNPSNQPVTLPFMGMLTPEPATNSIAPGGSFLSSLLPKAGLIHTDLGFNPNNGDQVLLWQTNHYLTNTWSASSGWSGGEPSLRVGEGFLLLTSQTNNWVAPSPTCPAAMIVPSKPLWTDSCYTVTNGDVIRLTSLTGIWSPDGGYTQVGPDGTTYTNSVGFLGPAHWASLIAFVGPNPYLDDQGHNRWQDGTNYFPRPAGTNYYFVGAAGVFTNTLRPGKLWFGFNDDAVQGTTTDDNTGFVRGFLQITHH